MKRAKIMLTAIAVVAIVGGALAFNAKTMSGVVYCTNGTNVAGTCGISITQVTFKAGSPAIKYILDDGSNCTDNPSCNVSGLRVSTPL